MFNTLLQRCKYINPKIAITLNSKPHPHWYQFYGSLLLNDNVIGSATSESGPEMSYQQGTDTSKNQIALFYNPQTPKE